MERNTSDFLDVFWVAKLFESHVFAFTERVVGVDSVLFGFLERDYHVGAELPFQSALDDSGVVAIYAESGGCVVVRHHLCAATLTTVDVEFGLWFGDGLGVAVGIGGQFPNVLLGVLAAALRAQPSLCLRVELEVCAASWAS